MRMPDKFTRQDILEKLKVAYPCVEVDNVNIDTYITCFTYKLAQGQALDIFPHYFRWSSWVQNLETSCPRCGK